LLGCHPHPLMKRSAPAMDTPTAKRFRDASLDAKRANSLVDIHGFNWSDIFRNIIQIGAACPYDANYDDFWYLWMLFDKNYVKPDLCWCPITEDKLDGQLKGIKRFYFPSERRCRQIWRTVVMFSANRGLANTTSIRHHKDDADWIDYTSSRKICCDYWAPLTREETNALTGGSMGNQCEQNLWFDVINRQNYEIQY